MRYLDDLDTRGNDGFGDARTAEPGHCDDVGVPDGVDQLFHFSMNGRLENVASTCFPLISTDMDSSDAGGGVT